MGRQALKRTAQPAVRSQPVYPCYIQPCEASNIGRPPTGPKWVHEIKFDGFRSQLHLLDGKSVIYSRSGYDWTDKYRSIADAALKLKHKHLVLDGEMVVLREDGTCDFWGLQKDVRNGICHRLTFFAFDILYEDSEDLRRLPYLERKERLRRALDKRRQARIRFVEHYEVDGPRMWDEAHKFNVEGIVSKRLDAPYRSRRGEHWIKTPCQYRETLFVAGLAFDGNEFGGLYLARRRNGMLVYAGKVEDGFTDEAVATLRARLDPLLTRKQPVVTSTPKPDAKWVDVISQIRILHRGGLSCDRVRRPVFDGIVESSPRKPMLVVPRENIMRELPDAVVPTAAALKKHWRKVGRLGLPHLANRPLTLVRHVAGKTFYHMGPLPPVPPSVHQLEIRKADGSKGIRLWIDDVKGLLGLVDLGVVEVHPWAATIDDIEHPDFMIFDLDPGEGIGWELVAETALALRDLLHDEGFDCWPKLTGGAGLHLMAPIERGLTHKEVHAYALSLAQQIAKDNPRKYTTLPGARHRIGKLFIDHLRNGRGFTAIGAYSPRVRAGFPVAVPTTWKEIARGVQPEGLSV